MSEDGCYCPAGVKSSQLLCLGFWSEPHKWRRGSKDQAFWHRLADNELAEALNLRWNENVAKNVIVFVGDGMGPNTVTAARIVAGGETHRLSFEAFPHMGLLKTYSADMMVPDSAATATALFCGAKTRQRAIGVDASASDCERSMKSDAQLTSLAALALQAGKSAGLVTTMRVTHATPAPLYAHSADRRWECDANVPPGACKDHARQLIEDWPGRDFHVIMGGGRQVLDANAPNRTGDPLDINPWTCSRQDNRNLTDTYKRDKESRGLKYSFVTTHKELEEVNFDNTDYLLGIFANNHMSYEHERNRGPEGMPSLSEMVEAAIKVLKKNDKGFFLMVEGGNIDMAHHRGRAKTAINEAVAMEAAVRVATAVTSEEDTLIIVTSDHTHTLTINGYPERGSNIYGADLVSPTDGVHYTTLAYGTGGPGSFHFGVDPLNSSLAARRDPSSDDTDSFDYEQVAAIRLDENSHGGSDVAVYARGPYAHLFHAVHEQHYVFHAAARAARLGPYSGAPAGRPPAAAGYLLAVAVIVTLEWN